jgi:uncharacterized protein DUF620
MRPMGTLRRLVPALALLLAAGVSAAPAHAPRQETVTAVVPEAREVIERYLVVTKWKDKLASASSRHDRGMVKFSGIQGTAETWAKKPDRQLFQLDLQGFGKMLSGYDGKTAWMSGQMTGSRLLAGTDLLQTRLEAGWDSMRKPAELYESLRTSGTKTFQGKECYELELVAKPLDGMDAEATRASRTSLEYYEIASGLLLGSTGRQDGELASGPFERNFLAYKELGGVLVPTVTKLKQGAVEMELTTDSVEFDTVTDEQVQPPLEIRTLAQAEAAPPTPPK